MQQRHTKIQVAVLVIRLVKAVMVAIKKTTARQHLHSVQVVVAVKVQPVLRLALAKKAYHRLMLATKEKFMATPCSFHWQGALVAQVVILPVLQV